MKTLAIATAALGLAATTTPAFAGQATEMSVAVRTSDINLATAEGQELLDNRIEKAVRTVCRINKLRTGTRIMSQDARACLAKARAQARQQVAALTENRQRGG